MCVVMTAHHCILLHCDLELDSTYPLAMRLVLCLQDDGVRKSCAGVCTDICGVGLC